MKTVRYTADKVAEWNAFVEGAKNGTFLFLREYMDYHSDRFTDNSLMYYNAKGKLVAVMPANVNDDTLYSHQGLTYGGFILDPKIHISMVGELFDVTKQYLRDNGIRQWYYKQVPAVYHTIPADEDEYWLWRNGATLEACNVMTAIDLTSDTKILSSRKRTYHSKLAGEGFTIIKDAPLDTFWPILEANLMERFQSKPVHTLAEITMLKERFPRNILCYTVKDTEDKVVAGTVLFITDDVIRTQYISASREGKQCNALDFLMLSLVNDYRREGTHRYFEFGTSMADDGIHLNDGLILQKENFGGRAIACRVYSIQLTTRE